MPNRPRIYEMKRRRATQQFYNQLENQLFLNTLKRKFKNFMIQENESTKKLSEQTKDLKIKQDHVSIKQLDQIIISQTIPSSSTKKPIQEKDQYNILKWQEENPETKTQKEAIKDIKLQLKDIMPPKQIQTFVQNIKSLNQEKCQNNQIVQQKVAKLIFDTISSQALAFQNPKLENEFLEQKQKEKQIIKKILKKQSDLLKNIENIQKNISLMKDDKNLQKISMKLKQKKQQFQQKKINLKQQCQSFVKNNIGQKKTVITCQNLDQKLLEEKISKMSNKMIKVQLVKDQNRIINKKEKRNKDGLLLGGNNDFQYQIKYILSQEQLRKRMNRYTESIDSVINASKKATQCFKQALQSHKLKLSLLEKEFKQKKIDNQNKLNQNEIKNDLSVRIDIIIVIDTTGSMSSMIQGVKSNIIYILKTVKQEYPQSKIRFGIVSYKDHPAPGGTLSASQPLIQQLQLSSELQKAMQFINKLIASGGGDTPQAVFDGLMEVKNLGFHPNSFKKVFLIADAPPHGKKFHSGSDSYPDGCPCLITFQSIVRYYKQNKIHLTLNAQSNPLLQVKKVFQDNFGEQLFSYGKITKQNFLEQISSTLLNQMNKNIAEKQKQVTKQFSNLCDKVIQKVQSQVNQLIKEVQALRQKSELDVQLKELETEFKKVLQLKDKLTELKDLKSQEKVLQELIKVTKKLQETVELRNKIQLKKKGIDDTIISIQKQNYKLNKWSRALQEQNLRYFYGDLTEQRRLYILQEVIKG